MKDRLSKYPGRVKLTPVAGQADTFDMIRADEPENEGTPLNKNTFLTDETAAEMGLDPASDPTPNDALKKITRKKYEPKVGDVRETMRDDLGENWVLCNGDAVLEGAYPELREVLPYNTEWKRRFLLLAVPPAGSVSSASDYDEIRPIPVSGQWALIKKNSSATHSDLWAGLYDENTDTLTKIPFPTFNTTNSCKIFGLTHDGNQYVLAVYENTAKKVHLFTSTDLVSWTDTYTFDFTYSADLCDFTFDGTSFLLMYLSSTSGAYVVVYSYNPSSATLKKLYSGGENYTQRFVQLPSGYWAYHKIAESVQDGINVYSANSGTVAFSFSTTYKASRIAFFSERYWIALPEKSASVTYIQRVDLTTNGVKRFEINDFFGTSNYDYLKGARYNKNANEWVLYFTHSEGSSKPMENYAAYISADDDPSDMTKYRLERILTIPTDLSYEQMHPDRSQIRTVNSIERYICNPNIKCLPTPDCDTYKYIYAGGTEE